MTPKYSPISWGPLKNIEIENFKTKKMARAYVCLKISEYPGILSFFLLANNGIWRLAEFRKNNLSLKT